MVGRTDCLRVRENLITDRAFKVDLGQILGDRPFPVSPEKDWFKEMEKVQAIRDYKTSKYERRYRLTAKQKAVTNAFALNESDIDEIASFL